MLEQLVSQFTGATILPMTVLSPEDGDTEPASGIICMHIGNTHKFGGSWAQNYWLGGPRDTLHKMIKENSR